MQIVINTLIALFVCTIAWSAELLVVNQSCSDPSCMKEGDVASIHPDGTKWEEVCKKCIPPMWRIVKLPGVPEKDLQYLTEQLTEQVEVVDPMKNVAPVKENIERVYTVDGEPISELEAINLLSRDNINVTNSTLYSVGLSDGRVLETTEVGVKDLPLDIENFSVKPPQYRSEIIRERKYSLPTTLKTATYDSKGMYAVPTKSIDAVKSSFIAKELTAEKTAVLAEKEALSAEISR